MTFPPGPKSPSTVMMSGTPSWSTSASAGVTLRFTAVSISKCSVPSSPESTWTWAESTNRPLFATTTTSGTSHRSISPSPLSSVRFATSGVTQQADLPSHSHCTSGSKASGGADSLQSGNPSPFSATLQMSPTGPVSVASGIPSGGGTSNFGGCTPSSSEPVPVVDVGTGPLVVSGSTTPVVVPSSIGASGPPGGVTVQPIPTAIQAKRTNSTQGV